MDYLHANGNVVGHVSVGQQFEILISNTDFAAEEMDATMVQFAKIKAGHIEHALAFFFHATDELYQGCFTCTAYASEVDHFSFGNAKGNIREGLDIGRIKLRYLDQFNNGRGRQILMHGALKHIFKDKE